MDDLWTVLYREFTYIRYYFDLQLRQIFWYWVLGMAAGSLISVFAKDGIHGLFARIKSKKWGLFGIVPACLLGIASPLCMYGTIPVAASFRRQGMRTPRSPSSSRPSIPSPERRGAARQAGSRRSSS